MRSWVFPAASVVVLLVAVGVWGLAPVPVLPTAAPPTARGSVLVACPGLDTDVDQWMAAVSTPDELQVATLGADAEIQVGRQVRLGKFSTPLKVRAERDDAFGASAWASAESGPERGLSGAWCAVPSTSQWLPGVLSNADAVAELLLVNLDQDSATADLEVFTDGGRIVPSGSRGIVVPPNSGRVVSLSSFLDDPAPLSLRVSSAAGRVSAYVRQRSFQGTGATGGTGGSGVTGTSGATGSNGATGAEWISPAAEPAQMVTVPAVLPNARDSRLVVVNPGEQSTSVTVEALTAAGAVTIAGVESLDLPGQSTKVLPLPDDFADAPVALRLTSVHPVTAAVLADSTAKPASADPLVASASGVLPARATFELPSSVASQLLLSNGGVSPATVVVRPENAPEQQLSLAPETSVALDLPSSAHQIVVENDGDAVRAAVIARAKLASVRGVAIVPITGADAAKNDYQITYDPRVGG
jgi:hypothetical protein